MKKIITFVLAVTILFTITACAAETEPGVTQTNAPETSTTPEPTPVPIPNIDPTKMNWGMVDMEDHYGYDFWYPTSGDQSEYIYFMQNLSESVCSYIKVINGKETESFGCIVDNDGYLIDSNSEGKIKIAFVDNFTAYDFVTDKWYSRGDTEAIMAQFSGKSFIGKSDKFTLELKEDGTTTECFNGGDFTGTWELVAPTVLVILRDGDSEDYAMKYVITYDADGNVDKITYEESNPYSYAS